MIGPDPLSEHAAALSPVDMLASIGMALYGERWPMRLSRALGISDETVRRWRSAQTVLPATHRVFGDALGLLRSRAAEITDAAAELEQWTRQDGL